MSSLILPRTLKPIPAAAPVRSTEKGVDSAEVHRNCILGAGRILLKAAVGYANLGGACVYPLNSPAEMKGTYTNLFYGRVAACGPFAKRDGTPMDQDGWPLEPGTYIEHSQMGALKTIDGFEVINSVEIVRAWPPGSPPFWWPKEE